jgi:hypothetical protein
MIPEPYLTIISFLCSAIIVICLALFTKTGREIFLTNLNIWEDLQ